MDEQKAKEVENELIKLSALKKDGLDKIHSIKEEIRNIHLRKNIKLAEKKELIKPLLEELKAAKIVEKENKAAVKALSSKLRFIIKKLGSISFYYSKVVNNHNKLIAKNSYNSKVKQENDLYHSKLKTCSNKNWHHFYRWI